MVALRLFLVMVLRMASVLLPKLVFAVPARSVAAMSSSKLYVLVALVVCVPSSLVSVDTILVQLSAMKFRWRVSVSILSSRSRWSAHVTTSFRQQKFLVMLYMLGVILHCLQDRVPSGLYWLWDVGWRRHTLSSQKDDEPGSGWRPSGQIVPCWNTTSPAVWCSLRLAKSAGHALNVCNWKVDVEFRYCCDARYSVEHALPIRGDV